MATGSQRRTRAERVAALGLAPGQWERAWANLSRRDVLGRIALGLLAAAAVCAVIRGWDPPFGYRTGYTPARDVVVRVAFSKPDPTATALARERAQNQVRFIYSQDAAPLGQLRASLRNVVTQLTSASKLSEADPKLWAEFQLSTPEGTTPPTAEQQKKRFNDFRAAFAGKENLERFDKGLAAAFAPFEQRGLLQKLPQQAANRNQEEILVHPAGHAEPLQVFKIADVLIGGGDAIRDSLRGHLESAEIADRVFAWLRPRLKSTLLLDEEASRRAALDAAKAVPEVMVTYDPGQTLAEAGKPLDAEKLSLLRLEYDAANAPAVRSLAVRVTRGLTVVLLVSALFLVCGIDMRYRQRGPLLGLTPLGVLLVMAVATVALSVVASTDAWRAEIIPPMIFGMTLAVVYGWELALVLSYVLAVIVVLGIGLGLSELLLLVGVTTTANLNMGRIRSRSKLIYVGLAAGAVAAMLVVGMGVIDSQPLNGDLANNAIRAALWALAAGFLMTGLLPLIIEPFFGVLTDLSLLELGDVAHPLLQELVRRAPSTYNHSITVGSIAEAAADSIGARGLLVRVGAYFHDIGKMLKPGYFIENQGSEANRHDSLVPAMSTLVIIAHIKDGADLARQYRLPQPIIDLIAQHHGTTLVEYFYDRAHEQQRQADPDAEVDESTFRYPGPKPQTKEAAVLMLADAVESASRTLVDPTPARIESLVRALAERRLHGGQFDESGLTLRELRTIERSMVMSLTAIYHGRLKYPEQKTA